MRYLSGVFFRFLLPLMLTLPLNAAEKEAPEEAFFQRRADFYIRALADADLDEMHARFERSSFFRGGGGDRHKYAMGPVIARLVLDNQDEQALRMYRNLMHVDTLKSDRGLYHFAAFQKTRMFFQLWDDLPDDFKEAIDYDVRNHFDIMRQGGTENHQFMNRTSGYVWAERLEGEFPGARDGREGSLAFLRPWLIDQVRRNFHVGNGEWDSSTYIGFSAAGWANIYDFSRDDEMKDWARAMLDWYAVATARKYFHGLTLGPESRGFARDAVGNRPNPRGGYDAVGTHTDWVSWLWWDASAAAPLMDRNDVSVNPYPALNLALSDYRPHRVIRNIARKNVPLPYSARGAKAYYRITNELDAFHDDHNRDHEVLFFHNDFAMGTLYSPSDGVRTSGTILPQTTMFKLAVREGRAVHAFGMSNGYHGHFPLEGRTPYDQYHQHRAAAINIAYVFNPDDSDYEGGHDGVGRGRTAHRSIFGYPAAVGRPVLDGEWYLWEVGNTFIGARPLGGPVSDVGSLPRFRPRDIEGYRFLVSEGALGGWIVQAAPGSDYDSLEDFAAALREETRLDLSAFDPEQREVSFTCLEGHTLRMIHTGGPGGRPEAWVDGEALSFKDWPVYESPYVRQEVGSGVLELNDGVETLTIDIRSGRPVWTEGRLPEPEN
jgi:hypothetical protein